MHIIEVGFSDGDWIHLAPDRVKVEIVYTRYWSFVLCKYRKFLDVSCSMELQYVLLRWRFCQDKSYNYYDISKIYLVDTAFF
jgi:hypothetical protein